MSVLHPIFGSLLFPRGGDPLRLEFSRPRLDASPSADAYRRDGFVLVHMDLPGIDRKSLSVTVDGQWLEVSAERTYAPEPGDDVLLEERPFGRFTRRFRLPGRVDASGVVADLVDGVLTVKVPVAAPAPTAVRIDVSGASPVAPADA